MKKIAIGLLGIMAAIAVAVGLAILPTVTYTASAATASVGTFADDTIAAATGAASTSGPSGSAAGDFAICPGFVAIEGSCSVAAP
ncbi:MAG: hypothetical protein M3247_08940 [Thermoproteota archaeon]|nr:hypothetical protein [Thermoproteota archaeon]